MPDTQQPLVVAVPKGRVLEQLVPFLQRAGIDTRALVADSRLLIRDADGVGVAGVPMRFLLLKPDDVPTYVEYGAADLGIVGRDVLLEREYDLYAPVDLGIGRCQLMVCGEPDAPLTSTEGRPLRVATKFPGLAARHFRAKGQPVELVFVQGSVELAPLTGLADVIVDLVETGETLRQNGLVPLEPICDVSSVVIVNRASLKLRRQAIDPLLAALADGAASR